MIAERACSYCNFSNQHSAKFCSGCGRPMMSGSGVAKSSTGYVQSQLPRAVAERLAASPQARLGERKHITILFADVCGSTAMVENMDPEEALRVLGAVQKAMMDAVHSHDGFVNRTQGDGIMALFGAPLANESHAVQACQAALTMLASTAAISTELEQKVDIRIGVHSGDVIVHSIGNDFAMSFDAAGKTVHLAARLEEYAAPDTVRISGATHQLAKPYIEAQSMGLITPKGLTTPIESFVLIRMAHGSRWQTRAARGLTRLSGRKKELDLLFETAAIAATCNGQVVGIVGEPGIGKSRLVHEFVRGLHSDWAIFEADSAQQHVHTPYSTVGSLFRNLLRVKQSDGPDEIAARLQTLILNLNPSLVALAPAILSVMNAAQPDPGWKNLDPVEQRRAVLDAVRTLLIERQRQNPVLLILEDLQWTDAESRYILEQIAQLTPQNRVILLVTERPPATLTALVPGAREIGLEALDGAEIESILDDRIGSHPSMVPLRRHIQQRGHGNPFFIEELIAALAQSGTVSGAAGSYQLTSPEWEIVLPQTISAVIAARIDQLSSGEKTVLQTAAVLGPHISYELLRAMMPPDYQSLEQDLQRLNTLDILFRVGASSVADLEFKHELLREIAYNSMLDITRQEIHGRALVILEAVPKEQIERNVEALAYHAHRAGRWEKALPYQIRSTRKALRRGANADCIAIVNSALATLSKLPVSEMSETAQVDVRLIAITAMEPLGQHERILVYLNEALEYARKLTDARRFAAVKCQLALAWWRRGNYGAARLATADAQVVADKLGDVPLQFAALHSFAIIDHQTGNFSQAVAGFERCLEIATPSLDERRQGWAAYPSVILRTFLADSLLELGRIEDARQCADEGLAIADGAGHAYSRVQINQVRGRILLADGQAANSVVLLEETWRTCLNLELVQLYPIIATRLGEALIAVGNPLRAQAILMAPDKYPITEREFTYGWGQLYRARADAARALGEMSDAEANAQRALEFATQRGERPQIAAAQALLGAIAVASGNRRRAVSYYRRALAASQACEMRVLSDSILKAMNIDIPALAKVGLTSRARSFIRRNLQRSTR